jgi:DNA polymerase I-like protein with 3'-5' exonuclease and polymerase domains
MFECYLSVAAGSIRREQEELDRKIISTIIQASTADCVNTGLANTYLHCIQNGIDHKIHLFVHDEVVFSVPTDINIDLFVADIKRIMESPGIPLVVPLRFDPKIGDTWADLKG